MRFFLSQFIFCSLLSILLFSSIGSAHDPHKTIVLSFDIDGTLAYTLEPQTKAYYDFEYEGKYYKFSTAAGEVLDALLQLSDENLKVEITFFSGGKKIRNEVVLKELYLPFQKKSAYDVTNPAHIFSLENLTLSADAKDSDPFSHRFKKNLSKIGVALDNVIHIDDDPNFMISEQKENLLWIGSSFFYRPEFNENDFNRYNIFVPKNKTEWHTEKNKLIWTLGILTQAITDAKSQSISAKKALRHILPVNANQTSTKDQNWDYFYQLGSSKLKFLEQKNQYLKPPELRCKNVLAL